MPLTLGLKWPETLLRVRTDMLLFMASGFGGALSAEEVRACALEARSKPFLSENSRPMPLQTLDAR